MVYDEVIEIESAKERFMGNYGMFSKYLYQFTERSFFEDLERELKAGHTEEAFDKAHDMKGVVANLSLKPLREPLHLVVETLRAGKLPGAEAVERLKNANRKCIEAINQLKRENRTLF